MKAKELNQLKLLHKVLEQGLVTTWDAAVDGGAHKGGWSRVMARWFEVVHAIEPDAENFEILGKQVSDFNNVVMYQAALMGALGYVEVFSPDGKPRRQSRQVRPADHGVPAITIDSMGLQSCGLIKLDLEGCEALALAGARDTLKRCQPVLIVEMKDHGTRFGHSVISLEQLLKKLGYHKVLHAHPDGVFVPI